ncbi:MAG TPA: DUF2934 domain-containing protein [Rhodospirillaceae bacterium]|nr:DUF2934 domain-containing protein [Rhodospirillaceae bacterium]
MSSREDQIKQRAFALWESEGRRHGQDLEYWLRAEAEIIQAEKSAAKPKKTVKPAVEKAKPKPKAKPGKSAKG